MLTSDLRTTICSLFYSPMIETRIRPCMSDFTSLSLCRLEKGETSGSGHCEHRRHLFGTRFGLGFLTSEFRELVSGGTSSLFLLYIQSMSILSDWVQRK